MDFVTRSQLRLEKNNIREQFRKGIVNEANERRSKYLTTPKVSVFLSHKHDDAESLESVMAVLEKTDATVYIDWMDKSIPSSTSGSTAKILKKKIRECSKFILVASEEAIKSKWCNWELGIGDAAKFPYHIALFVITEDDGRWSGSEYLQIYPSIGRWDGQVPGIYQVKDPDGTITPLSIWLGK